MTGREKVIKGLECCGYTRFMDKCQECPYDGKDCFKQLKTDALALLKAQKPITGETSDGYHTFNELYHHRAVLFSVIVNNYKDLAWKSVRHHDGTMYDGMFIVGIDTPDGQATYHYDINPYWDMFKCRVREFAPEWDGHTPAQAIERIGKLKAREPETSDVPKPDSDIGCWYDITHNYTLEQVVSALKVQEPPTSEFISSAIECLLHPQDADDSDMAKAIDTAVRAMRLLKAQEPRVMTLEEVMATPKDVAIWQEIKDDPDYKFEMSPVAEPSEITIDCNDDWFNFEPKEPLIGIRFASEGYMPKETYGATWRCWTSRPDEKRRAETPWE